MSLVDVTTKCTQCGLTIFHKMGECSEKHMKMQLGSCDDCCGEWEIISIVGEYDELPEPTVGDKLRSDVDNLTEALIFLTHVMLRDNRFKGGTPDDYNSKHLGFALKCLSRIRDTETLSSNG